MNKGKLILVSLAVLALPVVSDAQTRRTRRTPAARPPARRNAPVDAPVAGGHVNLTADDMSLIVGGLNFQPEVIDELASNAEDRKSFAQDLRRMLAAAAEARATGYAERPEIKLQMELARAFVISQEHFKRLQQAGAKESNPPVSEAEIDAFLKEPATAAQLDAFIADYVKNGPDRGAPLAEAQRSQLSRQYARVMVGMRKGLAEGLGRDHVTQLLVMLQQARLLSGAYSKDWGERFKATDAEVDAYIAKHPELDPKVSRAKAEDILRRVRAGEDFAALAGQFSEDPGSRTHGGDLGWFGRGMMVKPFEDATFALKPGEVSGIVESQFGYHIIKLEERRPKQGGAGEEVHARHILIGFGAGAQGDPNSPPMSPRDRARMAVEKEKRDSALNALAVRHGITVAEDYEVGTSVMAPVIAAPNEGPETTSKPKPTTAPAKRPRAKRRP
ncbi:MAG: peptidylprolyl isomerase [Pyrinomonadaceae bacterium]